MIRKKWNRKAYVLYFGIIGVVIALFVLLYFSLVEESGSTFIGEQQLQILVADAKAQSSLLYLDYASTYAVQQAIYTLAIKGGFSRETSCGTYYGAASWQKVIQETTPEGHQSLRVDSCDPIGQLQQSFEQELNDHLQKYLQHDQRLRELLFHLEIIENVPTEDEASEKKNQVTIVGTAEQPIEIDILKELIIEDAAATSSLMEGIYPATQGETGFFSRQGMPIDRITIHYTVTPTTELAVQTFLEEDVSIHYILGTEKEGFKITQMVPEEFGAYHAGGCSDATCKPGVYESMNRRSIGIEIVNWGFQKCGAAKQEQCPEGCQGPYQQLCVQDNKEACDKTSYCWQPYPEGQYLALVGLIADIVERHESLQNEQGLTTRNHIIGHNEIKYQKADPGPKEVIDLDQLTNNVNAELIRRESMLAIYSKSNSIGAAIDMGSENKEKREKETIPKEANDQNINQKQGTYRIQPAFSTRVPYSFNDYSILTTSFYGTGGVIEKTLVCEKQGRPVEACLSEATEAVNNEFLEDTGLLLYNGNCDVQHNIKTDFLEYYDLCKQSEEDQCICEMHLRKDPKQKGNVEFVIGEEEKVPFQDHETAIFRPDEYLGTIALNTVNDLDKTPTFSVEEIMDVHVEEASPEKVLLFYKKEGELYLIEDGQRGTIPQCRIQKRMFLFCAAQQREKRVFYDPIEQRIVNKNVEYAFAIAFPDITPPKPVKNSIVYDKPGAEESVILTWDKSEEKDIEAFSVFTAPDQEDMNEIFDQETTYIKEELSPVEFLTKDAVFLEGGISRAHDLQRCTWNLDTKTCDTTLLNGETIHLGEGILYETRDEQPYYLLVLHSIPDGIRYQFAIVARDIFKNEINNIDEGQKINKKIGTSTDDLPPAMTNQLTAGAIEVTEAGETTKQIRLQWELPLANLDGSSTNDIASFIIKYGRERGATKKTVRKENVCIERSCHTTLPYLGQGTVQIGVMDEQGNIFDDWEIYTPAATVS